MIKIFFCPTTNAWETDYITHLFVDTEKYEIIHYKPFEMVDEQKGSNVLVVSHGLNILNVQYLVQKLSPIAIFHLSDEAGTDQAYYNIYNEHRSKIRFLYHQYNHINIDYKIGHSQLPLGYVSGLTPLRVECSTLESLKNKKQYTFSFVGQVKSDREEMLNVWQKAFESNCVITSKTNWSNPDAQLVTPSRLGNIYSKSWFVPIGRGNQSIDCFRIYEAIVSGAIPVITATELEVRDTFAFDNDGLVLIIGTSWTDARDKCGSLLADPEKMMSIIKANLEWWYSTNAIIKNNIQQYTE